MLVKGILHGLNWMRILKTKSLTYNATTLELLLENNVFKLKLTAKIDKTLVYINFLYA